MSRIVISSKARDVIFQDHGTTTMFSNPFRGVTGRPAKFSLPVPVHRYRYVLLRLLLSDGRVRFGDRSCLDEGAS
jgi:hypothetical protein